MVKSISWRRKTLPFLAPLAIVVLLAGISKTPLFNSNPSELSVAITLDLLLTIPLVYFFLIRKSKIPKVTIVPIFGAGMIIASFILPKENQLLLDYARTWVLPVIELTVAAVILFKVRKTVQLFRKESSNEADFYTALKNACRSILPLKVDAIFAMEISVFYYSLFAWKKRKLGRNEFTYHRDSSVMILLGVFLFVLLIETFVVHLLLQGWSSLAAWILTILSIYTAFQLFAILKSISRRPILIGENMLFLKYGLFAEAEIPFDAIKSVELSSRSLKFDKSTRHLSPLKDADSYNVILEANESQKISGLYGVKKTCNKLAFHVDEKEKFYEILTSKLSQS